MRDFTDGRVSAPQFEEKYLAVFKAEAEIPQPDTFDVLDGLFADVDEYVADPDLRARAGGLDDEQLRGCAERALARLAQLYEINPA